MESNLALGRVDIAIKRQWIHRYPEHAERMATTRESIPVGFTERAKNGGTLDHPTVQHNKLLVAIRSSLARFRQISLQLYPAFLSRFQCSQSLLRLRTIDKI